MRPDQDIDDIMQTIPEEWRIRWCGGESGPCGCLGCVQIGNRIVMAERQTGEKFRGDPEYISESRIDQKIFKQYKITKDEWQSWMLRHGHTLDTYNQK